MTTDLDLADACAGTYTGAPQSWGTETVHVYLSEVSGVQIIAFEGTTDLEEWGIDFDAVPYDTRLFKHETLGVVHLGWYDDVQSVRAQILAYMKKQSGAKFAVTGHSKGAGEALIFAAECIAAGLDLERVTTFGTPHPGSLNNLLSGISGADYHNGPDPVWEVPPYLPHPSGRIHRHIKVAPPKNDPWGLKFPNMGWHHMNLYREGVRRLWSASHS